ncbi:MAG: hypothetical protein M1127_00695 [Patescibacteria group bacterium]|nr:hypothetical protein [Patescibacteria group bacterium]
MIVQAAGYLSGISIFLSFVPYIKDIFAGKTKPERGSWLIWSILGFISFFSQLAKGGVYSLVLVGTQAVGDLFVFILAVRYGVGGLKERDIVGLGGAMIGLVIWYFTKEAATALFIAIFIDGVGAVLTIIKSYEMPGTETVSAWVFTFLGGFFACIAVGSLSLILLAFPVYMCLISLLIILAIRLGKRRLPLAK